MDSDNVGRIGQPGYRQSYSPPVTACNFLQEQDPKQKIFPSIWGVRRLHRRPGTTLRTVVVQCTPIRIIRNWMAMIAMSGDRSIPAILGTTRWMGLRTGRVS